MSGEAVETTVNRIQKLTGLNYASWSFQMKMILMEQDLWSTVEPGEPRPQDGDQEKLRKFQARQGKSLAKICLSLGDEQQCHIQHMESPRDVWKELEKLYAPTDSKFRIIQLRRQLYSEKFSDHASMDSYLGKLNHVVSELARCGDSIDDSDLAMIILCGLSEDWDNVVSVICNLQESEFTCANVKRRLIAEYERRRNGKTESNVGALTAEVKQEKKTANRTKSVGSGTKKGPKCFRCGKRGHIAKNCGSFRKQDENSPKGGARMVGKELYIACGAVGKSSQDVWVIDSGATHHMTPDATYFTSFKREERSDVVMTADGNHVAVVGKGTAEAKLLNNKGLLSEIRVKDTILVPGIKHGVLSVTQMTELGHEVVFRGNTCRVYDKDKNLLVETEKEGRLFALKTEPFCIEVNETVAGKETSYGSTTLELWHRRMMHISAERILKMSKTQSVIGLEGIENVSVDCDDCAKGKSTRQPFSASSQRQIGESTPLALVHCDLMGPFDVASWGGSKYALCITDDATRYVSVYFLRRKGDTLAKFREWVTEAQVQTKTKLQKIRTDNGLEFCSKSWETFCKAHGIRHERSMAYTPEQNGIAERMNRTLLDLVRSTISSSGLPKPAWAELMNTAAYLRNRVTNKRNENQTPYELWTGRKPNGRHLRTIGCKVFVHIPKQKRKSKLTPRAREGYLVGYALRGRGWRIWFPGVTHGTKVEESRDCTFHEGEMYRVPNDVRDLPAIPYYSRSSVLNQEDESGRQNSDGEETPEDGCGPTSNECPSRDATVQRTHPMTLRSQGRDEPEIVDIDTEERVLSVEQQPITFQEAMKSKEASQWLEAVQEEMESLAKHDVWELAPLPKGAKPIGCRWVMQKKTGPSGETLRYKARLVAKGYSQRKGIDFDEVYSPVASFEVSRILSALAIEKDWILDQYDVKTAYLHGKLDREIFMEQPEGFKIPGKEHLYCKLKRSLYGLRQSGRQWNECLDQRLKKAGFIRNPVDLCVYKITCEEGSEIFPCMWMTYLRFRKMRP